MKDQYNSLIDERNEDLWRKMNAHFNITINDSPVSNYISEFGPDGVSILVDRSDMTPASFTHELLHLYIKYKDTNVLSDFKEMAKADNELLHLLSQPVINHICNCMEHSKMLPMFLERNFQQDHFSKDFHSQLMDRQEVDKLIHSYIKNDIYDGRAVQTFIKKFFSMKATANTSYDYKPYFMALKKLDTELYSAMDGFWENWLTFKIGNPPEEYQRMLAFFLADMRTWKTGKTLVY